MHKSKSFPGVEESVGLTYSVNYWLMGVEVPKRKHFFSWHL
jgi:hypothetical protein